MEFKEVDAHMGVVALTREEGLQLLHDLANQLADAPNAGGTAFTCTSSDHQWKKRVAFMIRNK